VYRDAGYWHGSRQQKRQRGEKREKRQKRTKNPKGHPIKTLTFPKQCPSLNSRQQPLLVLLVAQEERKDY
jgi:hypothetical protein